jgi:hypothetical protein
MMLNWKDDVELVSNLYVVWVLDFREPQLDLGRRAPPHDQYDRDAHDGEGGRSTDEGGVYAAAAAAAAAVRGAAGGARPLAWLVLTTALGRSRGREGARLARHGLPRGAAEACRAELQLDASWAV